MNSKKLTAVLDACVLYPAPLRDFLMSCAFYSGIFKARFSNYIHDEWMYNLSKNRTDINYTLLERTKELMNRLPEGLVENECFDKLIPIVQLPDLNDRHVLALAIFCKANYIVTLNLKDFPANCLSKYNVQPIHPDDFGVLLMDINEQSILHCFNEQLKRLQHPPKTNTELLNIFDNNKLCKVSLRIRHLLNI